MIEYIKNILPRIQKQSLKLDKVEVFVDKPWVFIDEDKNLHEYMFLRDNRLIMSLNGIAKEGKWEIMPNGKLLINRIDDSILLQNMFIDDSLMLLKKSGSSDMPFTLINEHRIPDLDIIKYLKGIEELQSSEYINLNTSNLPEIQINQENMYGNTFLKILLVIISLIVVIMSIAVLLGD